MSETTVQDELYLQYLEDGKTVGEIAALLEVSASRVTQISRKLKDIILERQRDRLAVATVKAVGTMIEMLDADASTEKGELRLKASESIMNRTGLTSHTSVEVQVESENGIFILPAKSIVPKESLSEPEEDDLPTS